MDRQIVLEEPKAEAPAGGRPNRETYRAPRLIALGTAVGLIQGWQYGPDNDGNGGWQYRR